MPCRCRVSSWTMLSHAWCKVARDRARLRARCRPLGRALHHSPCFWRSVGSCLSMQAPLTCKASAHSGRNVRKTRRWPKIVPRRQRQRCHRRRLPLQALRQLLLRACLLPRRPQPSPRHSLLAFRLCSQQHSLKHSPQRSRLSGGGPKTFGVLRSLPSCVSWVAQMTMLPPERFVSLVRLKYESPKQTPKHGTKL